MKDYEVTWVLSVEADSPIEAMDECWKRLYNRRNDWYWTVKDLETGKEYEINCDVVTGADPVITEINQLNNQNK